MAKWLITHGQTGWLINLKTGETLGLSVSPTLLASADKVIDWTAECPDVADMPRAAINIGFGGKTDIAIDGLF